MEAPIIKTTNNSPFIHQYNFDNFNYELELNNYNNKLYIKVTNKSKVEGYFFFYEETIENIYKLDKYFMIFENIEEIKNNIIEILKEKESVEMKLSKEKELKLIIKAFVGKQVKYIEFILTKKEENFDNLIYILFDKINSLERENELLKKKVEQFENLFCEEIKKKQLTQRNLGSSYDDVNRQQNDLTVPKKILSKEIKNSGNNTVLSQIKKSSEEDSEVGKIYSFECLNYTNLISYIYEGTEETEIELVIKNNGSKDWPKNKAKLRFDINSDIFGEEVVLEPQKCGEKLKYKVKFKKLESNKEGEYKSYLNFIISGKKIKEKLDLRIIIKKKENPYDEFKHYMEEIMHFRQQFELSEEDFPNKKVFDLLKKNDFDYEMAFENAFDN